MLFTGPSGSGKSSLLRAAGQQLDAVDVFALKLPDVPLIDALPGSVEERLAALSACGLSEARLLLRTPSELSDGQRYRFRVAFAWSLVNGPSSFVNSPSSFVLIENQGPRTIDQGQRTFLLADEFAAVLDRPLAKVLAFNLRKLVTRSGVGILCATTHDDLVDDLNPDVCVRCLGDGQIDVERRAVKKNESASRTNFGSRMAPAPTGRTSHGGIIAAITSPTFAG